MWVIYLFVSDKPKLKKMILPKSKKKIITFLNIACCLSYKIIFGI